MNRLFLLLLLSIFSFSNSYSETIAQIQGMGASSPYDGLIVTTSGTVTGFNSNGFFLQDAPGAWNGVYVYSPGHSVATGDSVSFSCEVDEYFDLTELKNLTGIVYHSFNRPIPAPVVISTNDANMEMYEGVMVKVMNALCTNPSLGFGEFEVNDGSGASVVDDLLYAYVPNLGLKYDITGALHYSFGAYKIEPRNALDINIAVPLYFTRNPEEENMTQTSLTFDWETNIVSNTIIEYGLTPALELGMKMDTSSVTQHTILLDNLTPGTIYYVRPYSVSGVDTTPTRTMVVATVSTSSGQIKPYFNHAVDFSVILDEPAVATHNITDTIIAYIDSAKSTLDMAMYENEDTSIIEAINAAYNRGVGVRIIVDDVGNIPALGVLDSGIEFLLGNPNGIMHNKFILIDRADAQNCWVITGSTNHTKANLGWDFNNMICIQDQSLAKSYTIEFEEMWGSNTLIPDSVNAKFGNQKEDNTAHKFLINGIPVNCYFSPSDAVTPKMVKVIDDAQNELAIALLIFTENSLGTAVRNAHNRGVDVKGIIDEVDVNGSEFTFLQTNMVPVVDYMNADSSVYPNGPQFHHKYAIIDYSDSSSNPITITGSHNWTASAASTHDENTLFIYDANITNQYYQEFHGRWTNIPDSIFMYIDTNMVDTNIVDTMDTISYIIRPQLELPILNAYPIPTNNHVYVEVPEKGRMILVSNEGKAILSKACDQKGILKVNLEMLPSGIYYLMYSTQDHRNYYRKVSKN